MTQVCNKYKSLLQAETWNAPSPELQKIMTLETKIEHLQTKQKQTIRKSAKGARSRRRRGKVNVVTRTTFLGCSKNLRAKTKTSPRLCMTKNGGGAPTINDMPYTKQISAGMQMMKPSPIQTLTKSRNVKSSPSFKSREHLRPASKRAVTVNVGTARNQVTALGNHIKAM